MYAVVVTQDGTDEIHYNLKGQPGVMDCHRQPFGRRGAAAQLRRLGQPPKPKHLERKLLGNPDVRLRLHRTRASLQFQPHQHERQDVRPCDGIKIPKE